MNKRIPSLEKKIGALIFSLWLLSCAGQQGISSLDVQVSPLPYSITVLPFEYPRQSKGKASQIFHMDSIIGQELQRWNFFKNVSFPVLSSSDRKPSYAKLNDLILRGKVTAFQASCAPESTTTTDETSPDPGEEKEEDPRKRWREEQNTMDRSFRQDHNLQELEWGKSRFNDFEPPHENNRNLESSSDPFSFEWVKYDVYGKLEFIIQIYGRQTNKKIYEKVYRGELNETVTAFTATPETADEYVSNILLNRLLKDFLENLAIDFYQYTNTKDFILKTNLPKNMQNDPDY